MAAGVGRFSVLSSQFSVLPGATRDSAWSRGLGDVVEIRLTSEGLVIAGFRLRNGATAGASSLQAQA
jgi:hypothetical protein